MLILTFLVFAFFFQSCVQGRRRSWDFGAYSSGNDTAAASDVVEVAQIEDETAASCESQRCPPLPSWVIKIEIKKLCNCQYVAVRPQETLNLTIPIELHSLRKMVLDQSLEDDCIIGKIVQQQQGLYDKILDARESMLILVSKDIIDQCLRSHFDSIHQ